MFGIRKQNRLRNGKLPQLKVFFYKNLDNLQNFKFLENLIKISCFIDGKNSWIDKKAYEVYRTKNLPNLKFFFFFCKYKVRGHFEGKMHTKVLQRHGVLISYILSSSKLELNNLHLHSSAHYVTQPCK